MPLARIIKLVMLSLIGSIIVWGSAALPVQAQIGAMHPFTNQVSLIHAGYRSGIYGRYHYGRRFYHGHRRNNVAGAVLFGLGAGLIASQILHNHNHAHERVIVQERVYMPSYPLAIPKQPSIAHSFGVAHCRQIREYQTIIIIDGQKQEAYGDACLQPDGSWLRGPAKLVPDF